LWPHGFQAISQLISRELNLRSKIGVKVKPSEKMINGRQRLTRTTEAFLRRETVEGHFRDIQKRLRRLRIDQQEFTRYVIQPFRCQQRIAKQPRRNVVQFDIVWHDHLACFEE